MRAEGEKENKWKSVTGLETHFREVFEVEVHGQTQVIYQEQDGIQLAKPAQASISAMKGSGAALLQKDWFPTTF